MSDLLTVEDLSVRFAHRQGEVAVVRGISFSLDPGEFVGLVGESGSGKSLTALAILGLLPPGAIRQARSIRLAGREISDADEGEMRSIRGGRIAMVFQEPMTALNPVLTIGYQIAEAIHAHHRTDKQAARAEAARLLDLVAIPRATERLDDYPHQLSGGQRQRAMIAMALAAKPELLIADEPTTALDVTIQAQILELLEVLRDGLGLTILLITHDLAVVAETCDRAMVMYAGRIVEEAGVESLFARPSHPYTRGLLGAQPDIATARPGLELAAIPGQIPDPSHLPEGCAFHPRCGDVMEHCSARAPELYPLGPGYRAACFLHEAPEGSEHAVG